MSEKWRENRYTIKLNDSNVIGSIGSLIWAVDIERFIDKREIFTVKKQSLFHCVFLPCGTYNVKPDDGYNMASVPIFSREFWSMAKIF